MWSVEMNPLSGKVKVVFALLVGVVLFTVDLLTGFLAAQLSGMLGFILVLFIVGFVSGGVKNGLISALLLLVLMIPIGIVLYPYLPDLPATTDLIAMALMLMVALMCRPALDIEGEPAAVCCFLFLFLVLVITFAPGMYFLGFLIGGVGGFFGRYLWGLFEKDRTGKVSTEPATPPPQTPP